MKTNMEKPMEYFVSVERNPNPDRRSLLITIDGETHEAEAFEFSAPIGTGLAVQRVTRLELVPEEPKRWQP